MYNIEQIKVILKFSTQKIFEMYYYSEMNLPEIILLAEASSHAIYNKTVFANLSERGFAIFESRWLQNRESIQNIAGSSENRIYYNDSIVGIWDLIEKLDDKLFSNTNSKLLFIIIIILTKINEL